MIIRESDTSVKEVLDARVRIGQSVAVAPYHLLNFHYAVGMAYLPAPPCCDLLSTGEC